nr:RNA-directed DNA polymerase, eukaryota [Tanacetum cinerariifolium]
SAQLSRISDLLDTVVLSNMGDRRFWDLNGDGCFRVKDVRRMLDDMLLPKSDVPSRWVKQIPIKVNVLSWKISMDRLSTRVNLHRRGVQECFTLHGGVSGHIETISSSLIQILEKMAFLKTLLDVLFLDCRSDGKVRFQWEKTGVEDGEKTNSMEMTSKTCVSRFILTDSRLRRFRYLKGKWSLKSAEVMKLKVKGSGAQNMKRTDKIFEFERKLETDMETFWCNHSSNFSLWKLSSISPGRLDTHVSALPLDKALRGHSSSRKPAFVCIDVDTSRETRVRKKDTIGYGYSSVGRFDVFFCNQLLVFQQHQDESLYGSWTHFKDIIRKVPNHGLSIWTLIEILLKHLDSLFRHIINLIAEGDLMKFSDIGAWYAIEDCVQHDKKCSNPTGAISDETIANPNAQIVRDDMVMVQVPRCMAWLDYDEHVDSLSTMDNEVGVTSPESTTQNLPLFEEYTLPVTYPEEVEKTLGTPIKVESLNKTKLEEVGLNCIHNTLFSSKEVPSFDGPEPQTLLNSPSLDVSLGDVICPKPPIKPHSPDSSRMKALDYLTTQTPPSSHVANSHPKVVYSYYNLGIDDP